MSTNLPQTAKEQLKPIPNEILRLCVAVHNPTESNMHVEYGKEGIWCYNNGTLAFIDEKGLKWATPYTDIVVAALKEAGYVSGFIYVPYSNGDVPKSSEYDKTWENLRNGADARIEQKQREERELRHKEIAEEKGIASIDRILYNNTLEIPALGLTCVMGADQFMHHPEGDWNMDKAMGTYTINNSRLVFVNEQGRTFVTPFVEETLEALQRAGYQSGNLSVPLSNCEEIWVPENFPATDLERRQTAAKQQWELLDYRLQGQNQGMSR